MVQAQQSLHTPQLSDWLYSQHVTAYLWRGLFVSGFQQELLAIFHEKLLQMLPLAVLYDATTLTPLKTLTLHTLQVAVMLPDVLRVKYLYTKDMLT